MSRHMNIPRLSVPEMIPPADFPVDLSLAPVPKYKRKKQGIISIECEELYNLHGLLCSFDRFLRKRSDSNWKKVLSAYEQTVVFYDGADKRKK